MKLQGIDGADVFVRGDAIVMCSKGVSKQANPAHKPVDGPTLASDEPGEPPTIDVPCLVLAMRGMPPSGVADTPDNVEEIETYLAKRDRTDGLVAA